MRRIAATTKAREVATKGCASFMGAPSERVPKA
jgi:hypothetical protein